MLNYNWIGVVSLVLLLNIKDGKTQILLAFVDNTFKTEKRKVIRI
jgi:hypothetical protein